MEIIQERLEREYDMDIVVTAPSVEYEVNLLAGEIITIDSPAKLPDQAQLIGGSRTLDEACRSSLRPSITVRSWS